MRLPIWAAIYVVLVIFIVTGWLRENVHRKAPVWYVSLTALDTVFALLIFISYWIRGLIRPLAPIALPLYLLSLAWTIWMSHREFGQYEQPDLSPAMNRLVKRFGVALAAIVNFPVYWFGGIAVLNPLR